MKIEYVEVEKKMIEKLPDPQYLFDSSGNKAFVVLRIEEYEELMEDLHDLAIMAERRGDERMPIKDHKGSDSL